MNDVITAVGRKRFLPAALNNITYQGPVYSVPFVGFPFFIWYRKDTYKKLGLKPPKTHAELLANIKKAHDPPNQYGYMLTNQAASDTFNLKTAMWTHGAYYFDKSDKLALDRPQTIAAWDFYKQLGTYSPPGSMAQCDLDARQLLVDGKVAHMFTTTSFAGNLKPAQVANFGAFLYPSVAGAKGASLDFYGLSIPTKAQNADGAKAMIEFLLKPANFQQYLARTVVGWVPMLGDAYTQPVPEQPADQALQGVHRARRRLGQERRRRHRLLRAEQAHARSRLDQRREADRRPARGQEPGSQGSDGLRGQDDQSCTLTQADDREPATEPRGAASRSSEPAFARHLPGDRRCDTRRILDLPPKHLAVERGELARVAAVDDEGGKCCNPAR